MYRKTLTLLDKIIPRRIAERHIKQTRRIFDLSQIILHQDS